MPRTVAALVVSIGILALDLSGAAPTAAQGVPRPVTEGQCAQPSQPELYGPTDINAQSSNGGLAVALNREASITVLRWPSPSYYDQIKYHTSDRSLPHFGALPNEGAFLGLFVTTADGTSTRWLRDEPHTQGWGADWSDTVVTTYDIDDLGLTVAVEDVVARDIDVLARRVEVERAPASPVLSAAVVAFENLNLVVTKHPGFPSQDWCQEAENVDVATFDAVADAVVHTKSGIDDSTHLPSNVAIATGFAEASGAHQVGGDAYEGAAAPDGKIAGPTQDAYDDAADGTLHGGTTYAGQTTSAIATPLDLSFGTAIAVLLFGAGHTSDEATSALTSARAQGFEAIRAAKEAWIQDLVGDAPVPASDDPAVTGLARRALITLVTTIDRKTSAVVASIATQSPYGEDWIRDGAYFNYAFDVLGFPSTVTSRNGFYAVAQKQLVDTRPDLFAVPPGNWAMNYYADGVVGGPIPWEIDETGYGVWSYWQHHRAGEDLDALRDVWPSLKLAADFLVSCTDPTNDLQCRAIEDDNVNLTQTTVGAGAVWLGLDSAARAAAALGEDADAQRYGTRRDELGAAIDARLWDEQAGTYAHDPVLAWPVCFKPYDDPRMARHLDSLWRGLQPSLAEPSAGQKPWGAYEAKALIALAKAWRGDSDRVAQVRGGLEWIAHHHATPDTHIEGEVWIVYGGQVVTSVSQPHLWEQLLFWFAAIEAWPPEGYESIPASCDGVVGALAHLDAVTAPSASLPAAAQRSLPATGGSTVATLSLGLLALGVALTLRRLRRVVHDVR